MRLGEKKSDGSLGGLLVYGGAVGGVILANLLAPRPGTTRAREMPPVQLPESFPNLRAVALRFDEVKTLYRAGRLGFQETRDQIAALIDAAFRLETQGKAEAGPVADLAQEMSRFHDETFTAEQDIARTQTGV